MKRFTSVVLLNLILITSLFAQNREKTPIGGRPDIKGDLFLELGFNTLNNKPSELNTQFIQSRTFNIYYQYPIRIFGEKSGFTFNPGLGVASDKFAFQGDKALFNNPAVGPNSSQLLPISDVYGDDINVGKNNVGLNFLEIPLEFRYHFNKNNYDKSVRFAFGGKIGYLFQSQTKISYVDSDGLDRKIKDRQSFGFNQFRYGVHARLGFPGFNLWGYYGLNEVFQKNKGPFNTQATQLNFGVSIALF
ncbi:porin family protein [Aquiflexum gelatinilyticum]|uniref:porin family protein n=1 Tax=Aquiflexum gelatinilyticum TaxID=2961943 RepID=UPI00216A1714|nr:porin family protein [Aquiflexum gelatinilyticum]MCS4435944.1 PorT family protein [Aquiflexum gelatinilyticum]